MKCITSFTRQPPPSPFLSASRLKSSLVGNGLLTFRESKSCFAFMCIRTRALPSPIILATASPPTTGNLLVLLQTSAVLLGVYWIANFVVPEFILKDLQSDQTKDGRENSSED